MKILLQNILASAQKIVIKIFLWNRLSSASNLVLALDTSAL